jgi:hypothetical protein
VTPLQAAEAKFGVATIERFYSKVQEHAVPGTAYNGTYCQLWTRAKSRGGLRKWIQKNQYGNFSVRLPAKGRWRTPGRRYSKKTGKAEFTYKSHRFAWEVLRGPIPPNYEPDHQCPHTLCVNVNHMVLKHGSKHVADHNRKRKKNAA